MVTLKLRSPGSAGPSSPAESPALQGRNGRRGMEMILADIQDRVFRDKLRELQTHYPLSPLLFLTYTLVKSDQHVECARNYLVVNEWIDGNVTSIPATTLAAVQDADLRGKVQAITEWLETTVWWTAYALRVCGGSVNEASGLLTEGVIDATINPWESAMDVDTDVDIFTDPVNVKVERPTTKTLKTEPNVSTSPSASPAFEDWMEPPVSLNTNNETCGTEAKLPFMYKKERKSTARRVIDDSSDDEMTLPAIKKEYRSRSISRSTVETSGTEEDSMTVKVRQIQDIFPTLSPSECLNSLELCDGNVPEAISLKLENSSDESAVDHSPQSRPSSSSSAVVPQKRKSSTPDGCIHKKLRVQDTGERPTILPEAGQWVRAYTNQNTSPKVTVNLSSGKSRDIPQSLLSENSAYFRERLEGNGKQPAITEIDIPDVNHGLFDHIIQYLICCNISFDRRADPITTIIDLLVLSARLKIRNITTFILAKLEDKLKEARKSATNPYILKAIHIHKAYTNFEKHHPLRRLLVKACVRPYMEDRIVYKSSGFTSDSDSDSGPDAWDSDEEAEKVLTASDLNVMSREQGHCAHRFNREFKYDIMRAADKTRNNRDSRSKKSYGRSVKNAVTWYTDPFDSQKFTI